MESERKAVIGAVGTLLLDGAARLGSRVGDNTPFALRAEAGPRKRESGRRGTYSHAVDGDHEGFSRRGRRESSACQGGRGERDAQC